MRHCTDGRLRRTAHCWLLTIGFLITVCGPSRAAEKVRFYPGGEADDAVIGGVALSTEDIWEPPLEDADGDPVADAAGDFVPLVAFDEDEAPTYVEGREGGLALQFDGNDQLRSEAFDPRNFSTFASLSQAWVKPDSSGSGDDQSVWALGTDNGGAGITSDGFWQLQAVSTIPDTTSPVEVDFDQWSHVAVFRGGNSASLFVNGELAVRGEGFWNGPGEVVLGADVDNFRSFTGAVDDFNIAGFSDFTFDETVDLDFSVGPEPTGVAGDVDQDGDADRDDYLIWSENAGFDNGQGAGDIVTLLRGDLDGNGRINFFDFQEIASAAAAAGAPLAVPEPGTWGLAGVGFLAVAGRLRRRRTATNR